MRRTIGVLVVLLSLFVSAESLAAQDSGPPRSERDSGFELGQNYPNPFNPETKIPFVLNEDLFADGRPVVVSIRIFNLLARFVASPVALDHPLGEGVEVIQLEYTQAGRYEAFWDGKDQSGREVASGIYLYQITVNGVSKTERMIVQK